MPASCPECGVPVPEGGTCRDLFHTLLLLEGEVPGAPGSIVHFYTVATYALQHPDSMNYTADALAGLRTNLADALDGRVSVEGLRWRARAATNGPRRVTRRDGDAPVPWHRGDWPLSVAYVLDGGVEAYVDRVLSWARSVRDTLDAASA